MPRIAIFAELSALLGLALSVLPAMEAQAHHSFAMYDQTKTEVMTGKMTRFIPGSNHAQLIFELVDDNGDPMLDDAGKAVVWGVELGRAAVIAKQGITGEDFAPGTVLNVTLHPLRDGKTFGVLAGPIIRCGSAVPEGGCTRTSGEVFDGLARD
jgi:hypothetical protein